MENHNFNSEVEQGTMKFALDVLAFCGTVHENSTTKSLLTQLVRSSSLAGANYRAAQRTTSDEEFSQKLRLTEEALDESLFFLEIFEFLLPEQKNVIDKMENTGKELIEMLESELEDRA